VLSGEPGDRPGFTQLKTITFGVHEPKPVVTGFCIDVRGIDGLFTTTCAASYADGGGSKRFSVDFVPMAARATMATP
jgi:hypothetical protein